MARTLSANLTTEMNSSNRTPASHVTIERWFPEWTERISGLSGGQTEQYAHGHSVATAEVTGETVICRARSGSYAAPQNGHLYIAVIDGAELDTPANWDTLWVDTGITGLMYPAWTANSGASHGGSIAVVHSGTNFRVFYILATGSLQYVDVAYNGTVGSAVTIAALGTGVQLASMQIASCLSTEVFVVINSEAEESYAAWQPAVYGFFIRRYYLSGTWQADNSFSILQGQAEASLVRDDPFKGADFGDTSATRLTAQWGKRFCGGLACNHIDTNTVVVSLGVTYWQRWGRDTNSQSIISFIYYRNTWWERGPEIDRVDFNEDTWLHLACFARGFQIEGVNFLTFNRHNEPSDYEQTLTGQSIPRIEEVVYARFSTDGKYLTQYQYLGNPDDFTSASIIAVTRSGVKKLFAVGWRSISESVPATILCSVTSPLDIDDYTKKWSLTRNNRQGMTIDINLIDPSILTQTGTLAESGALARVFYGTPGEKVQAGQGFIDLNTPDLQVDEEGNFSESGTLNCLADNLLINTRAEQNEEYIPLSGLFLTPDSEDHITIESGKWELAAMNWPELFFSGTYTPLNGRLALRLLSFPPTHYNESNYHNVYGLWTNDGEAWADYVGKWYKNICWISQPAAEEGSIEASVRFGNDTNQSSTNFQSDYIVPNTDHTYADLRATVTKSNGVVTQISLTETDGSPFYRFSNWTMPMAQYAVMGGLICGGADITRKYMFIWEHDSRFSTSSFIRGPWSGEIFDNVNLAPIGTNSNMLYLIETDSASTNRLSRAVAGVQATGLTPGQPADLRIQKQGGMLHCFYRAHSTGTRNQWRLAFSYKVGRFSPGFGLVGRGHSPTSWRGLDAGLTPLSRLFNHVDFWDIKASDCGQDATMQDSLKKYTWRGFTSTEFTAKVSEASRTVNAGASYNYALPVENLTMDFKVSIPANTNEAGVFMRGVSASTPTNECIKLGLIAHSTANSATDPVNYYVVKRRYSGGSEVAAAREYAPLLRQLSPGVSVPVRVSARGAVYSVWVAGYLMGTFTDSTPLGLYFGLYATGGNASFTTILVPELYEVTGRISQEVNQAMDEMIKQIIDRRRIKGFYKYDGTLKFSYFETHATGPAFNDDRLWQSSIQRNRRYLSKVRVQGTGAYAMAQSSILAKQGQRFEVVNNPAIINREFAYREARVIMAETAEQQLQATFQGAPDLRVDPEDQSAITVTRQNIAGDFIIDDIMIDFTMGDNPDSSMKLSVRQTVAL